MKLNQEEVQFLEDSINTRLQKAGEKTHRLLREQKVGKANYYQGMNLEEIVNTIAETQIDAHEGHVVSLRGLDKKKAIEFVNDNLGYKAKHKIDLLMYSGDTLVAAIEIKTNLDNKSLWACSTIGRKLKQKHPKAKYYIVALLRAAAQETIDNVVYDPDDGVDGVYFLTDCVRNSRKPWHFTVASRKETKITHVEDVKGVLKMALDSAHGVTTPITETPSVDLTLPPETTTI